MRARLERLLGLGILPLLPAITFLDGRDFAARSSFGQPLASAVTLAYWLALLAVARPRLRRLMLLGLLPATVGELLFSLGFGMYEYRLGRIPLYVPAGHTLLYAAMFLFVRSEPALRHRGLVHAGLIAASLAFAALWWQRQGDVFGVLCTGAFALLWLANSHGRLFFAGMYVLVAWLELCGTTAGAWAWPSTLCGKANAIASANPPSGIAVFYALFDLSCLALYFFARFRSFERLASRLVRARRPAITSPEP